MKLIHYGFFILSFRAFHSSIFGFVIPISNGARETMACQDLMATKKEDEVNVSNRLAKAKDLLRQFTEEAPEQPRLGSDVTLSFNATEVPENVWSNGLLDGSDVVTRYAFRKGVKIADPLIKYSPELSEKILFKQPNRWYVCFHP